MEMNNRNKKIITISLSILMVIVVIGFTFAYFQAQWGKLKETDINVQMGTVDELFFDTEGSINIYATEDNFYMDMPNIEDEMKAVATLRANSTTQYTAARYNVYLNISYNDFEYTTIQQTPELLLQVYAPGSTDLYQIEGKTPVTVTQGENSITGYDITTIEDVYKIAENYPIIVDNSPTNSQRDEWLIKVIFVNLESDQSWNSEKRLNAKVVIGGVYDTLPSLCKDKTFVNCFSDNYALANNIILHSNSQLNSANDYSLRYYGEDPDNYVCFGSDDETCAADDLYRIIGVFKDYTNPETLRFKLVKDTFASTTMLGNDAYATTVDDIAYYYWSGSSINASNVWSESTLNTTALNTNYINYLDSKDTKWANMIAETTWKVGGGSKEYVRSNPAGARYAYLYEIGKSGINSVLTVPTNDTFKIGLLYTSDYMYGASKDYWNLVGLSSISANDYRLAKDDNWLFKEYNEWALTRFTENTTHVATITSTGQLGESNVTSTENTVRPTFYLNPNVKLAGGTGEKTNPFRLALPE